MVVIKIIEELFKNYIIVKLLFLDILLIGFNWQLLYNVIKIFSNYFEYMQYLEDISNSFIF